jgi:hypothetical protein
MEIFYKILALKYNYYRRKTEILIFFGIKIQLDCEHVNNHYKNI